MSYLRAVLFFLLVNCAVVSTARAGVACREPYPAPAGVFRPLTDTLVIPFLHKQSAIVHKFTLDVLDSIVLILKNNKDITLSIEGYAYIDEGSDTICKYLSLNRALFVKEAILGRGIDSSRISFVKAMGQWKTEKKGKYKVNNDFHCRVELLLIYPPPPKPLVINDKDLDDVADEDDLCPDVYGDPEQRGCPNKNVFLVPFERNQAYISPPAYLVLDRVLSILKNNPTYTIVIAGHAAKEEGIVSFTDMLSKDRANIIHRYLLSRNFPGVKIDSITGYGKAKPINAQRNPKEISENAGVEIIINKHEEEAK